MDNRLDSFLLIVTALSVSFPLAAFFWSVSILQSLHLMIQLAIMISTLTCHMVYTKFSIHYILYTHTFELCSTFCTEVAIYDAEKVYYLRPNY